jgi:hypothetical protein
MRTTYKAAALLIAAFSIPQLAYAGIIWDLTGTGKAIAESKLRGKGAEESHLTNWGGDESNNQNNNSQNNGDNHNNNNNNNNNNGHKNDNNDLLADDLLDTGSPWTDPSDDGDVTEPVVPVETVTEPVSVPEPMSLVLFATGLLAAAAIARRKSA